MMEYMELVGSYGFPIVVTGYLLYERAKFNNQMIKVMENITVTLENIQAEITMTRRGK